MQRSKYLIASKRDEEWGLTVTTVGYEDVKPGDDYPSKGHADGYYFNLDRGRVLNEYQVLYIVEGRGVFQSTHVKPTEVKAGDMFLLFPQEWHCYHPLKDVGWKSYWIGFKGRNMDERREKGFINPNHVIFEIGFQSGAVYLYRDAYKVAAEEAPLHQQVLAGMVNYLVGLMLSREKKRQLRKNKAHVDAINRAMYRIRETIESDKTIHQIAEECGISYSNFRKLFKDYTGVAPANYQQELRIQRAKELLSITDDSVKEIAFKLGFDSADYFSSKFKSKVGISPLEYRKTTR